MKREPLSLTDPLSLFIVAIFFHLTSPPPLTLLPHPTMLSLIRTPQYLSLDTVSLCVSVSPTLQCALVGLDQILECVCVCVFVSV